MFERKISAGWNPSFGSTADEAGHSPINTPHGTKVEVQHYFFPVKKAFGTGRG